MESYREFKEKMQEAGNDVEKMNEIINERLQMFISRIMSTVNPYSAVDEPFIITALEIVEEAFKENCSDGVKEAAILLRSKLELNTSKNTYKG